MRAFLWVSGGLGGAVVLIFALALLRERPTARVALPPALLAGEIMEGASAEETYRAWVAALPPAPVPLTTRYELRTEVPGSEPGAGRAEADLAIVNGNLGSLRVDLKLRFAKGGASLGTIVDGSIVLDGSTFWAWGSLPISEEFELLARGKVVRLPVELLTAFFQEGMFWLEAGEIPLPAGSDPRADFSLGEWIHPARVAPHLMRGAVVSSLELEADVLRVTVKSGSTALALLDRVGMELDFAASDAVGELPLLLEFDADTGELLSGACTLPDGAGTFTIRSVHRAAAADAAAFRYPADLQVFDLAPLAQMGLGLMRKARAEGNDEEF